MKFYGVGTIGKEIELKVTQSQIPVCSFSLACTRKFKDASGERTTDWFACTAWRKTAELIAQYFTKGDKIMVEGDLQLRSYDKDGGKVYVTDLIVESFDFCGGQKKTEKPQVNPAPTADNTFHPVMDSDTTLPFELNL